MRLPYENGSSRSTYSDQRRQGIYRLLLFKYGVLNNHNEVKKRVAEHQLLWHVIITLPPTMAVRKELRVGDHQQPLVSVMSNDHSICFPPV